MSSTNATLTPHLIGSVRYNVHVKDTHSRKSTVTENTVENGEVVTDHVILRPREVVLEFSQTNAFGGGNRAQKAWQELDWHWKNRTLFKVETYHDIYDDMVVESLESVHEAPFEGTLKFTVSLKQVNRVDLELVSTSISTSPSSDALTATAKVDGGTVSPKKINASTVILTS